MNSGCCVWRCGSRSRTWELKAAAEAATSIAALLPVHRYTSSPKANPVSVNPSRSTRLKASTGEPPSAITGMASTPCTIIASEYPSVRRSGQKMLASNRCRGSRGSWCATQLIAQVFSSASPLLLRDSRCGAVASGHVCATASIAQKTSSPAAVRIVARFAPGPWPSPEVIARQGTSKSRPRLSSQPAAAGIMAKSRSSRRPATSLTASFGPVPRYAELVCFSDDPGEAAANYFILKLMGFPDIKVLVM